MFVSSLIIFHIILLFFVSSSFLMFVQDSYHYVTTWYYHKGHETIQQRDDILSTLQPIMDYSTVYSCVISHLICCSFVSLTCTRCEEVDGHAEGNVFDWCAVLVGWVS